MAACSKNVSSARGCSVRSGQVSGASSESAVRQTLFSYLTAQKINVKEIEVKMDTREDTSIEMNQVTVVLDNADRAQADKIKELLSTQFSIDAQIVYS